MNMFSGRLTREDGELTVGFGGHRLALDDELVAERPGLLAHAGADVVLGIRPEDFEDSAFAPDSAGPSGRSRRSARCAKRSGPRCSSTSAVRPTGPIASLEDTSAAFVARVHPEDEGARGSSSCSWSSNTKRLHFFDPETGLAVYGKGARSHVATAAS